MEVIDNKINRLSLFSLTWPIFIEIFLYMLLGNVDTLMLSRYSDNAVAAVGVSNQILSMIVIMYGIVSSGTAILVAQYLGAKKYFKASEVTVMALFVNLLFGATLSISMALLGPNILSLMNIPPNLMDEATSYMRIVGGFSFIQALMMTMTAVIRSHGKMKISLLVTIGMNITNVIGNYLFIFGALGVPRLGVFGVGISTTISRTLGFIVLFIILTKKIDKNINFSYLRPFPKETLSSLLKIGIPTAGEQLSYNGSQIVITFFITMLGAEALTTRVYTQNIMMFIYLFSVAIGQGTQILIGHLVGAREYDDAYSACIKSLKMAIAISLLMAITFSLFRNSIIGIFTENTKIITTASALILLTMILEPGRAFNLVIINSLRASGDVRFPVRMGIISMWGISVVLSYVLGIYFGLGLIGMWIAFATDEWFRGLFMLWRWKSRKWQTMSFVKESAS